MKKTLISVICLCLGLVSCSAPPQTITPTAAATADPLNTPWADRSLFKRGLVEAAQPALDELNGASVYHLELNIADDLYHVSGHEEVQYTNTEATALKAVEFRLFPNILGGRMKITNLLAGGQSATPRYDLQNSLMILPFSSPLQPGQSIVIGMDFDVTVPQSVESNYGVLAYYENVLALAHAYPMIAVYDDEGWNAEIPPQYGDVTYADASFFLVRITAPKDVTVVTTGSEIDHTGDGKTQTIYVESGPARDFYLAASPLYEETIETFGGSTIRSYSLPGSAKAGRDALDVAARAVKVFSSRYEPYPYTEFDIVATPTTVLGIEYPGMIAIASRLYEVDENMGDVAVRTYLEATIAHEAGHQWFYNLVGNDQLDDPWLDESLTQFATLQYYEDQYGPQAAAGFEQSLEGRWARVNNEEIPVGMPVASYNSTEYGAIVYGRGALFFTVLREAMGVEAFDAFLKDYTEQLAWKIATPEFLQALAEKHCACDLDSLFQEWVYPK